MRDRTSPVGHQEASAEPVSLLDLLEEGRRARDAGQQTALHAADLRWKAAAQDALDELARAGQPFTADDVRERVGAGLASSTSALGAVIGTAARAGTIRCVGYAQSAAPSRKAGLLRVWVGVGGGGG